MKLVAAAKMKKAQDRVFQARPYAHKLQDVIRSICSRMEVLDHRLLKMTPEENIKLVVFTADRGLCGSFNATVVRRVHELLDEWHEKEIVVDFVGRKGFEHFNRTSLTIDRNYVDVFRKFDPDIAGEIKDNLIEDFTSGKFDAIYIVYNEFKSVLQQNLVVERLLPLVQEDFKGGSDDTPHLFEPSGEEVLDEILPGFVETQLYRVLIESNAAEYAARMTAMDSATNNATDMIDKLTLVMNKIRQAAITTEIIEVVSGGQISN